MIVKLINLNLYIKLSGIVFTPAYQIQISLGFLQQLSDFLNIHSDDTFLIHGYNVIVFPVE